MRDDIKPWLNKPAFLMLRLILNGQFLKRTEMFYV